MRKEPLNRKTVIIVLLVMVCSFFLGDKWAYYQMYRQEMAHRELLTLAASRPADEQALADMALIAGEAEKTPAIPADNMAAVPNDAPKTADKSENSETAVSPAQAKPGLININTAGKEELITLPGIGEVKAQAIIDYRTEHGKFLATEELMNINGIGEKTYENLKDLICV